MASLVMRDWIYSPDGTSKVTASESELTELITSGQISGSTLIWTEGQPEWIAVENSQFSGLVGDTAVCAASGRTMLKSQMLQYGNEWIDPDQKDHFVSGLMEGKTTVTTAINGPWPYESPEKPGTFAKWLILLICGYSVLLNLFNAYVTQVLTSSGEGDAERVLALSVALNIGNMLSLGLMIPGAIFYCIWLNRCAKNAHALAGRQLRNTPGMMVGYYFIPFANLWVPYPDMKEIWSVTMDYRKDSVTSHSIVSWWWGTWIGGGVLVGFLSGFIAVAMRGNVIALVGSAILSSVVQVVAGLLIFQIITRISERQVEIFEA